VDDACWRNGTRLHSALLPKTRRTGESHPGTRPGGRRPAGCSRPAARAV